MYKKENETNNTKVTCCILGAAMVEGHYKYITVITFVEWTFYLKEDITIGPVFIIGEECDFELDYYMRGLLFHISGPLFHMPKPQHNENSYYTQFKFIINFHFIPLKIIINIIICIYIF